MSKPYGMGSNLNSPHTEFLRPACVTLLSWQNAQLYTLWYMKKHFVKNNEATFYERQWFLPSSFGQGSPCNVLLDMEESLLPACLLGFLRCKPAHFREFNTDVLTANLLKMTGKHHFRIAICWPHGSASCPFNPSIQGWAILCDSGEDFLPQLPLLLLSVWKCRVEWKPLRNKYSLELILLFFNKNNYANNLYLN